MNPPLPHEYPAWGQHYISLVKNDVLSTLAEQANTVAQLFKANLNKADYAYANGKWTLKEMLGHLIDSERVFAYRITCFARAEKQALPGFDEDAYVANASFKNRPLSDLCDEFTALRQANMFLFRSLTEADLAQKGLASGKEITVKAILFIAAGHVMHHISILKNLYHVV